MKKVLVVATVINFLGFERNDIKLLQNMGYEVHCAVNIKNENERVKNLDIFRHQIDFSRSPFSKQTITAYKQLKELLKKEKFDLIHCHTPVGGILSRLAARNYRKKGELKVIYTAHGFHFFKGAPLKNWLLYYPIEWICSWFTDVLITINTEDYGRAKKRLHARETKYIPGVGLNLDEIRNVQFDRENVRRKLDIPLDAIVLTSVGEVNDNKNHEIIIDAMSKIKDDNMYYIICGKGPKMQYYQDRITKLGLAKHIKLLGHRRDVFSIYKASDICVFPSKREGLGIAALEGMASGLPLISSNVHGINDYSINGVTGYACNPEDINEFMEAICKLRDDPLFREKSGNYNRKAVEDFALQKVSEIMKEIYCNILIEM